jgi:hypothetical protein
MRAAICGTELELEPSRRIASRLSEGFVDGVAGAADGSDGVAFRKTTDMDVDRAFVDLRRLSPHSVQELRAREHPPRLFQDIRAAGTRSGRDGCRACRAGPAARPAQNLADFEACPSRKPPASPRYIPARCGTRVRLPGTAHRSVANSAGRVWRASASSTALIIPLSSGPKNAAATSTYSVTATRAGTSGRLRNS